MPRPRPLRLASRPLSLAPLNFASEGNYALFQRSTVGPPPLPGPPGDPSLVIWLRPLEATMPFAWSPPHPRHLRLAPQAPEFCPFEFCVWRQLSPFPEVQLCPMFKSTLPKDTIVMLVATLLRAVYAMLK